MKKVFALLAAGLMVMLIIAGCTEDPWEPEPSRALDLFIVSAPSDSTDVPAYSTINFTWSANGGSGEIEYNWYLEPGGTDFPTETSILTSVMYDSVGSDTGATTYTFHVMAEDESGATDTETTTFTVSVYSAPAADVDTPTVEITTSPAESSYVATGSDIVIAWAGDDGNDNDDELEYQYIDPDDSDTSDWTQTTSVSYNDVPATDPATFYVRVRDAAGNTSDWISVTFTIHDATILYIDDYQFLDDTGNPDMPTERDQKQFYRDALEGFAYAEWDIAVQGMIDSATIINYSTVIFGSDSDPGTGDVAGTWWYQIGAYNGGVVRYFFENGGNLLVCGPLTLNYVYNNNPPLPGDLEYDWFGIDSTLGWDYWYDFTWAVNAGNFSGLPDSMKIDVAKNGDQVDYEENIFAFRDSVAILFTKGLDIDGEEPYDYGESVGHIYYPSGGAARAAMINFDCYSMPPTDIRQTFQTILTEFGE